VHSVRGTEAGVTVCSYGPPTRREMLAVWWVLRMVRLFGILLLQFLDI
jgi:hypothetical protein